MNPPTFIVGTGRCGSTMLSNMIREHPKVLSLSEFFGYVAEGQMGATFACDPIDGRRFWDIIAFISPLSAFCSRNRISIPESLYDRGAPNARFSWETGVPAFLMTTLTHLTDDHDALFEQLQLEVTSWLAAATGEHYRRLFEWLARHFRKSAWVERSGSSLMFCDKLLASFPDAKFVHIVRDERDAAISMQQHLGLRIVVSLSTLEQHLGVDPLTSADRTQLGRVPKKRKRGLKAAGLVRL